MTGVPAAAPDRGPPRVVRGQRHHRGLSQGTRRGRGARHGGPAGRGVGRGHARDRSRAARGVDEKERARAAAVRKRAFLVVRRETRRAANERERIHSNEVDARDRESEPRRTRDGIPFYVATYGRKNTRVRRTTPATFTKTTMRTYQQKKEIIDPRRCRGPSRPAARGATASPSTWRTRACRTARPAPGPCSRRPARRTPRAS